MIATGPYPTESGQCHHEGSSAKCAKDQAGVIDLKKKCRVDFLQTAVCIWPLLLETHRESIRHVAHVSF